MLENKTLDVIGIKEEYLSKTDKFEEDAISLRDKDKHLELATV